MPFDYDEWITLELTQLQKEDKVRIFIQPMFQKFLHQTTRCPKKIFISELCALLANEHFFGTPCISSSPANKAEMKTEIYEFTEDGLVREGCR